MTFAHSSLSQPESCQGCAHDAVKDVKKAATKVKNVAKPILQNAISKAPPTVQKAISKVTSVAEKTASGVGKAVSSVKSGIKKIFGRISRLATRTIRMQAITR